MSEEFNQESQLAAEAPVADAAVEAPVKQRQTRKPAAKEDDGYPMFMRATKGFGYTDPESGIRFNPVTPVKVDVAPKAGSWLDSQIKAGLIAKA